MGFNLEFKGLKLFLKKTARWLFVSNTMTNYGFLQKEEIWCPAEMVNIRNILAVDAPDVTLHCLILFILYPTENGQYVR